MTLERHIDYPIDCENTEGEVSNLLHRMWRRSFASSIALQKTPKVNHRLLEVASESSKMGDRV